MLLLYDDRQDMLYKRQVWFVEGVALLAFSALVCGSHHTPYLLLSISIATFCCAFFYDAIIAVVRLATAANQMSWWQEFEEVNEAKEYSLYQQHTVPQSPWVAPSGLPLTPREVSFSQSAPEVRTAPIPVQLPTYSSSYTSLARNRNSVTQNSVPSFSQNNIGRPTRPATQVKPTAGESIRKLASRVSSLFGYALPTKPPGLQNRNQNLCFMNVILQTLARTPLLTSCMIDYYERNQSLSSLTSTNHQLFEELLYLVRSMRRVVRDNQQPHYRSSPLDTTRLRSAACLIKPAIVTGPYTRQDQQDAGEFLMLLLAALHQVLNQPTRQRYTYEPSAYSECNIDVMFCPVLQHAMSSLYRLHVRYAGLQTDQIETAKQQLQQQIESSDGRQMASYVDPLLRLSDIDWLKHKQQNNSVIDDLFTSQLIAVSICATCHHVQASTQACRILLIPIIQERTGSVPLQECLSQFGRMEEMRDFKCNYCNRRSNQVVLDTSTVSTPSNRAGPYGLDALSPIAGTGNSVYPNSLFPPDLNHRTSTPKIGAPVQPIMTDGWQRYWLREAPDCLIIQLLRFNTVGTRQPMRVRTRVNIPLDGVTLSDLILTSPQQQLPAAVTHKPTSRYRLYAMCLHVGGDSMYSGHYMAYAVADNGRWYKFDDEIVTNIDIQYELNTVNVQENVYILFYQRQL